MRGHDKWEAYFPLYERALEKIEPNSTYLEIGTQNMGWLPALDPEGKFTRCVACDINPLIAVHVGGTRFTDTVVGDSTAIETYNQILALELTFDMIVDDASHTQHDIITNFILYFKLLRSGGFFIIEDCHTDFSHLFSGDNFYNLSIYDFFTALSVLPTSVSINPDLRFQNPAYKMMRQFYSEEFCNGIVSEIKDISFANSCIMITKGPSGLGQRFLRGDDWPVVSKNELNTFCIDLLKDELPRAEPDLAIVFLNRTKTPEEIESRANFIASYLRHFPKTLHQLYVINKGFEVSELKEQYLLFKDLTPRFINIEDSGYDLDAYRIAAGQLTEQVVFFMNTHAEPLDPNWLEIIYNKYRSEEDIAIVGCTGNVETHHPFLSDFPSFPNYHIRSNGFMIDRELFLELISTLDFSDKHEAYRFECGPHSMTRMVQEKGMQALVVGRNGATYGQSNLWRSGIFRSGRQRNLLLSDNQTRAYQSSTKFQKLGIWALSHTPASFLYPARLKWQMKFGKLRWANPKLRWANPRFIVSAIIRKIWIPFGVVKHYNEITSSRFLKWVKKLENRHFNIPHIPETVSSPKSVVVLVPTHLSKLDKELAETLRHNAEVLKNHPLEVILPQSCTPDWYEAFFKKHGINGQVRLVQEDYFGSAAAVNKMGTDKKFYEQYSEYDYVMICHLDAWVFEDRLEEWMDKEYDFIGAPLFLPDLNRGNFLSRMAPFGANGGLSLRRVSTCIRVLETFRPIPSPRRLIQAVWFLLRNRQFRLIVILMRLMAQLMKDWRATCVRHNIYEDVFFTIIAPLCSMRINIPPARIAMRFAAEVNYDLLQKERLGTVSPVGIHGYDKYLDPAYLNYIQGFFKRKKVLYDNVVLPAQPRVSVVMIVKDLINGNRMDVFDQAVKSVENQTYANIEIVFLDGGSKDATYKTIKKRYGHIQNATFHQKADKSVWEGMANGVSLATGDLISVLNSDDYFNMPEALEIMVTRLSHSGADWTFGHTILIQEKDARSQFPTHLPSVLNCFGIVHQAVLIKKNVIEVIDPFRSDHITAENYLFVAAFMGGFQAEEVLDTVMCYRTGGLSDSMYSGDNLDQTVSDYVGYLKKLTSIGAYLNDEEIASLYGFRGIKAKGFVSFFKMIWKIKDTRLRSFLLQAAWAQARRFGFRRLVILKIKSLMKR